MPNGNGRDENDSNVNRNREKTTLICCTAAFIGCNIVDVLIGFMVIFRMVEENDFRTQY